MQAHRMQHVSQHPEASGERAAARQEADRRHIEEALDGALEMTFPASDPIAVPVPDRELDPDRRAP